MQKHSAPMRNFGDFLNWLDHTGFIISMHHRNQQRRVANSGFNRMGIHSARSIHRRIGNFRASGFHGFAGHQNCRMLNFGCNNVITGTFAAAQHAPERPIVRLGSSGSENDLPRLYPEHAERTTLYASDVDLPVHLSAKLHEAPRAGYYAPYTVAPGVDTVAVPDFDIDLLGHSYFAQAEALLHDMYDLIRHGAPPAKRQRISPTADQGASFWRLRR